MLDSIAAAQAVVASSHAFDTMIEIDTDDHRAGVAPESATLLLIGRTLHAGGAMLKGVMTPG